jgi:hypothetical protein
MKKAYAVGAGQDEAAPKRKIEYSGGSREGGVLGVEIAVFSYELDPVHGSKPGT